MFEHLRRIGATIHPITYAEILKFESDFQISLPESFAQFLMEIGGCAYCGEIIVFSPEIIRSKLASHQDIRREYYFWENPELLSPEILPQCLSIGGTVNGDDLVIHPKRQGKFYILPRHNRMIFEYSGSYIEFLDWIMQGGQLYQKTKAEPYVEGFADSWRA